MHSRILARREKRMAGLDGSDSSLMMVLTKGHTSQKPITLI